MLFGPQNKRSEVISNIDININGVQVSISEKANSLGVVLDSELRFECHNLKDNNSKIW
nr:unnamed protein product [Callosobruchus analis]